MAKNKQEIKVDKIGLRENGEKNKRYVTTGKAGCFGTKKVEASIDRIVEEERATFEDAISKWGVDKAQVKLIEPVVIQYYIMPSHTGKDGVKRAYGYGTYVLGFSEKQILLFMNELNVYDKNVKTQTDEFFYKDVTSITVIEDNFGSRILLRAGGAAFESGYIPKGDMNEGQIQGVKNLIREKKE